jgi:hypothetical protein
VTKAPIIAKFVPSIVEFSKCRPRNCRGFELILPASLRNATMEPVKVTPPMTQVLLEVDAELV